MTTTLTELNRTLKKILDEVSRPRQVHLRRSPTLSIDFSSVNQLLQQIIVNTADLTNLDINTDDIETLLIAIGNNTDDIETQLTDIETNTDGGTANLIAIAATLASLLTSSTANAASNSTTAGASLALVISNAAILINTGQIETAVEAIQAINDDIRTAIQALASVSLDYSYIANLNVTGIGGGTLVEWRIEVPVGQSLLIDNVLLRAVTGNNTWLVQEIRTATNDLCKLFHNGVLTAPTDHHQPHSATGQPTEFQFAPFVLQGGHALRVQITGVAVADIMGIAIQGKARTSTLPTIDQTGETATTNKVAVEHQTG